MMKKLFILIVITGLSLPLTAGGGWPQPKGWGFFKFGQWWLVADQHFTDAGLIDPNVTTGLYTTFFYGEYGFTNRLTGIIYAPVFTRAVINNTISGTTGNVISEGDAINSIGDFDLTLKYGLITDRKVVFSASLLLGIPLGNPSGGRDANLQTGDGEFNQMLRFDASTSGSIGNFPIYGTLYSGFNNRTNGFSDEFRWGLEVGGSLFNEKLYLIVRVNGVKSLFNGVPNNDPINTTVFANNSEFVAFQPEILYNFSKKFGISASRGTAFSGRLILARPTYSVGIHYLLK